MLTAVANAVALAFEALLNELGLTVLDFVLFGSSLESDCLFA